MKRTEPISVGEALREFFEQRQLGQAFVEGRALSLWAEVVGQYAASATEDVYIRNGVIYVTFSSAAVRAEVMMRRNFIIADLNRKLGSKAIRSISLK